MCERADLALTHDMRNAGCKRATELLWHESLYGHAVSMHHSGA